MHGVMGVGRAGIEHAVLLIIACKTSEISTLRKAWKGVDMRYW